MLNFRTFSQRYFLPNWHWYAIGTIFLGLTNYVTVCIPAIAGEITSQMGIRNAGDLSSMALALVGLGFAQILSRTLSRLFVFWPGRIIEARSKVDLFRHTTSLPQEFLDQFGVGDLISRLSHDLGQLRVFFAFGVLMMINLVFLITMTFAQMWSKNPLLTVLCLSPLILMFFLTRLMMPRLHQYNRESQESLGKLTNRVTEAFVNVHPIKAAGAEDAFAGRIDDDIEMVYQTEIKLILFRTVLFPLMAAFAGVSQVIVLIVGGYAVIDGTLKVGDILAFNIYLSILAFPLTSLGIILAIYQRGKAALERLDQLDSQPSQGIRPGDKGGDNQKDLVLTVRDLTFCYPTGKHEEGQERTPALMDFNLEVRRGEKIGLCGPVGSGKSTLFKLLTRIYDPPEGKAFYLGQDVLTLQPTDLRQQVGYALQSPHLFSATIRENLEFGLDDQLTDHDLREASRQAMILDDIEGFTEDWNTPVGEKGLRLSGGQKHRLALARLYLRRPPVWLLDNVLSAVDTRTEAKMVEQLFGDDKTLLIASHRSLPLSRCDRVLYIVDGRLVDQGTFSELKSRHPGLVDPREAGGENSST